MNDRLSALRLFARAARVGNFSCAGRELGLSRPSASRLIAALEEEVDATLFSRTTRAVTLTEDAATVEGNEDRTRQNPRSGCSAEGPFTQLRRLPA